MRPQGSGRLRPERRRQAISVGSSTLPRRARRTALPCSAALPTIATITTATKNCERCASSAKVSSEPTSMSVTEAVTKVASARPGARP